MSHQETHRNSKVPAPMSKRDWKERDARRCACGARITNMNPKASKCSICYERVREAALEADEERVETAIKCAGGRAPRYMDGRRVGDE